MKKFAIFIVVLAMAFVTAPFGTVTAANEQTVLRVYNWGEYISNGDDESLDVIAEFELRNPDINVEYTTYA
ncbi:MAG: spermidine/putrescine ABC transporter substrate-binding protein, partial [Oscillospiraceae bacterium]